MRGRWHASCPLIRFAWVIACIAAVVAVNAADSGPGHSASTCGRDDSHYHEPGALRREKDTIGAGTNRHDHGTRGIGDEPEDPALILADYYKRLDRSSWSLADWQKVGAHDIITTRVGKEVRTGI